MQSNIAISLQDVTFKRSERTIFDNVTLHIPRGKVSAIMGPSGCGKTTLLRLMTAELRPHNGDVFINETNLNNIKRNNLFEIRRNMGVLFQSGALFNELNVFENVAFPLRVHTSLSEEIIKNIVLMKLQAVGLRGAKNLMPDELSGGMKRRVSLARAIALDPEFLFYDEPFAGQDPIAMGVLVKLIKSLTENLQITTVIVSHDIAETASIADHIFVVGNTKVLAQGTAEEILNSKNENISQFIQGLPDGPVPFHFVAQDYLTELME